MIKRVRYLFSGVVFLLAAGAVMAFPITVTTLLLFGLLRSISGPMFGVPYSGVRMDIITQCAEEPAQRIEYLSAWETPLAIGRVIMMFILMGLYGWLSGSEIAVRIALFIMCAIRILTYQFVVRTDLVREEK